MFAAIAAFLAFINPYDATGGLIYPLAWLYWFAMIVVGGLSGGIGFHLPERLFGIKHWSAGFLLAAILSALGVSVCIYFIEGLTRSNWIPLWFLPQLYFLVFVISLAITGVTMLVDKSGAAPADGDDLPDPVDTFMERLPVKYRSAALYAVSSEDHYLRVHTDKGEELILMRLADAMRELAGADGLQTHRSWWVAKDGVAEAARENGKLTLKLKSGADAPVSRTYQKAVKEAGLT